MMGQSIFPKNFLNHSDFELENLADETSGFFSEKRKIVPVVFRETEKYGFGVAFRDWLRWPWYIPLPLRSDHGVEMMRSYSRDESKAPTLTYVTWSSWRSKHPIHFKRTVRTQHPWITYRQGHSITKSPNSIGTLVFVPHTMTDTQRVYDFEKYFRNVIERLPSAHKPITLCLQANDIKKGLHKDLRKFGYPIVTAGHPENPWFMHRFYKLVSSFNYATSPVIGSQLFYCEEMGVRYFLAGDEGQEISGSEARSWYVDNDEDLILKTKRLFAIEALENSRDKYEFLKDVLGLDSDLRATRKQIKQRLLLELIIFLPIYSGMIVFNFFAMLRSFFQSLNQSRNTGIN